MDSARAALIMAGTGGGVMSGPIDFIRWLGEVFAPARSAPPRRALGVAEDRVMRLRREGAGYVEDGPAGAGDALPLYLDGDQALSQRILVPLDAAAYGPGGARIEAARRCPFPLEDGASMLTPTGEAWGPDGAPWLLAAAPRQRLAAMREAALATGARPGPAFTLFEGRVAPLQAPPKAVLLPALAVIALIACGLAAGSLYYAAAEIEGAAEARLAEARAALAAAEADAADAAARREAAASPLIAAAAASAALSAAPPAARALVDFTAAAPDDAYARRATIRPGEMRVEISAPDAAGLATRLAGAEGFASARLATSARVDAASGLQRATLDLTLKAAP